MYFQPQFPHPSIEYQSYASGNGTYLPPGLGMSPYVGLSPYSSSVDRPSQSFKIDDILLHSKTHSPYSPGGGNCPSSLQNPPPPIHGHYPPNVAVAYRAAHYQQQASSSYPVSGPLHECQAEKDLQGPSSSVLSSLPVYFRFKSNLRTASGRKCRKPRTVFSEMQLLVLEREFSEHRYLSTPQRTKLADRLGLNQTQVKTWFQNRRMKWKKETTEKERQEGKLTGEMRPLPTVPEESEQQFCET